MAGETQLFKIDTVVADGVALPIADDSASLTGAARWENEVQVSSSGDDFNKRKRVPTTLAMKLQFGPTTDPAAFAAMADIQITGRDSQSGRRCLMPRCSFGSMGAIGGGAVDVVFNVLAAPQWL